MNFVEGYTYIIDPDADLVRELIALAKCSERYDVVFADPPYQMNNIDELLAAVIGNRLLTDDGIFILEHNRHHSFDDHPNLIDSRKYGNVHFSLFRAMDGKLQHSNNINTSIE